MSEDGFGFGESVIDIGAEGVEGDTALHFLGASGHFGAAEASADDDFCAFRAALHCALDGLLDGASEGDAALELLGDVAGDECGIEFGDADFFDINTEASAGDIGEFAAEFVDVLAAASNDDAGFSGPEFDAEGGVALDIDAGDGGVAHALVDVVAEADVLGDEFGVAGAGGGVLLGVPLAAPLVDGADAEAGGMHLLAHGQFSSSERTTVMWQVRLRMRPTRPRALARKRRRVRPSPA